MILDETRICPPAPRSQIETEIALLQLHELDDVHVFVTPLIPFLFLSSQIEFRLSSRKVGEFIWWDQVTVSENENENKKPRDISTLMCDWPRARSRPGPSSGYIINMESK